MTESASAAVATARSGRGRPWVEQYRPSTLDDVIAHDDILATLRRLMENNAMPHLLFYGPPGTGKTTTIQACARQLYGQSLKSNVLEMNASDDRGIDVVRNEIKDFASTGTVNFFAVSSPAPNKPGIKLIILDEADQMSHDAQAALRRVIEKYTKNVRFCIVCNHINKIIPAVQSRCTRFRFGPVKKSQTMPRLVHIVETEKVTYTPEGLAAAFKLSHGDLRRCINMMQATNLALGEITEAAVYQSTGNPAPKDVMFIVETMLTAEFSEAWAAVSDRMHAMGLSVVDLVREVHGVVQRLDVPQDCKCHCYIQLADIEYNLAAGTNEAVALAALVGTMQLVRESISTKTPMATFGLKQ
jgi:replication factor C subunit 3/5